MQSCVLFVLSLSIQSSAGWNWPSWNKKPVDDPECKIENPPSDCLWTPGRLGAVTVAKDVYPGAEVDGTAIDKTTYTNQAVILPARRRDRKNCLDDATIKVCAVFDEPHVNENDNPGPNEFQCPASNATKGTTKNVCGLHAHTLANFEERGPTSCDGTNQIGGHFFNSDCDEENCDQWADSHLDQGDHKTDYECTEDQGEDSIYVPVNTFWNRNRKEFYSNYTGLPFVTHNANSTRVGCSVLSRMPSLRKLKNFKYSVPITRPTPQAMENGYPNTAKPRVVRIDSDCDSDSDSDVAACSIVQIWAQLEPYKNTYNNTKYLSMGKCSIDPNSCGMHIHAGTACDADSQGPHYVATKIKLAGKDPWDATAIGPYQMFGYKNYRVIGPGVFTPPNPNIPGEADVTAESIEGRVYVQHGKSGDRQWCGVIRQECEHPSDCKTGYCLQVIESQKKSSGKGWPKGPKPVSSQKYCCQSDDVFPNPKWSKWGKKYCEDKAYDNYPVPDNVNSRMLWQDEPKDDDEERLLDDDDEESSDADVLV